MGIRIIVTKDNNELYLELNIFYNIVILILGILALFLNGIYCYIIFKEKLWTQSIQYVLNMFISSSGILLGLRHIVVSIVNLTMFDSAIFSYDVPLCKVKSSFDVLILYFFETSFGLKTTFFTILIGLPILYKNYVENARNNKYIVITITSFSLICTLFYILDIDDSSDNENCNIHSFIGKTYEYFFIGIIILFMLMSIPMFIFGVYKVVKLNLNKNAKDSVIKLFNYFNFMFFICWTIPRFGIIVLFFLRKNGPLAGLFYDISILTITIISNTEFIFAVLHNKTIKDSTFKLLRIKNKVNAASTSKN